jgi:hypothetical protein
MIHLISIQFVSPACPSSEVRQSWKAKKIINFTIIKKKKKMGIACPLKPNCYQLSKGA